MGRCVGVLRAVYEAVVSPTGEGRGLTAEARAALARSLRTDYCASLTEALLPLAVAAAAAAATDPATAHDASSSPTMAAASDATKLLELAVKALPDAARATLPLPLFQCHPALFRDLITSCESARSNTELPRALASFATLSELEASGATLRARLLDLRARLLATPWAALSAPDGPHARAVGAAAQRLRLLCRTEAAEDRIVLIAECLATLASAGVGGSALGTTGSGGGAFVASSSAAAAPPPVGPADEMIGWSSERDMGEAMLGEALRRVLLLLHRALVDPDP